MIQHPRVADAALAASVGSFLGAHWFLVAQTLLHMGAEVVSIVTGITALAFYFPAIVARIRSIRTRIKWPI